MNRGPAGPERRIFKRADLAGRVRFWRGQPAGGWLTLRKQFNMLLGQPRSDGVTPETGEPLPGLSGPGANGGS